MKNRYIADKEGRYGVYDRLLKIWVIPPYTINKNIASSAANQLNELETKCADDAQFDLDLFGECGNEPKNKTR